MFVKKRPFGSEGHLRLPGDVAPSAEPKDRAPFERAGRTRLLEVPDDRLAIFDLRTGDRVVLLEGRVPEFGDLAWVVEEDGAALWKVFPERRTLSLSDGHVRRTVATDTVRVAGVVLGILRRLPAGSGAPRA